MKLMPKNNIKKFFIILNLVQSVTCVTLCTNNFIDINNCHARLLKQKKMQFCYISYVQINGTVYLVKQKRNVHHVLAAVHDVFAARIAHIIDPTIAHNVALIPAFYKFPGKIYDDWPATIHTLASGKTIKNKIRSPYRKMNIKQAYQGLRRDMLPWIAKHKQLAQIVALDIFLCNHDRHRGNLFYNDKTDAFCAIDMDIVYKYNLAEYACSNLLQMAESGSFSLKADEVLGLLEMKETLEKLTNKYSPQDLRALFDDLLQESGLIEGSPVFTSRVQDDVEMTRYMIGFYYKDVKKLIDVLRRVIQQAISHNPALKNNPKISAFERKTH